MENTVSTQRESAAASSAPNYMPDYIPDHPIVALATPYAKSPIALIRISGAGCLALLYPLLRAKKHADAGRPQKKPETSESPDFLTPRKATLCMLMDGDSPVDECVATAYRAPASYTGEDAAELALHGSIAGIERALALLRKAGFADALPGEFTKRAFLRGKMDLTQAEAVHDIIEAHSAQEHERAVRQLSGALFTAIDDIKQRLVRIAAVCAVSLDYPDDEIQESTVIATEEIQDLITRLEKLAGSYEFTALQRRGAKVVLGGKTNAGKSSLFNALLKEERAIVSAEHGTTRDYLEREAEIGGIPVVLYDTAGLRESAHTVEAMGMEKSYALLSSAQAVLYVVDAAAGWDDEDTKIVQDLRERNPQAQFVIAWNKQDALDAQAAGNFVAAGAPAAADFAATISSNIPVSAKKYENIRALQTALFAALTHNIAVPAASDAVISSARQQEHILAALGSLRHVMQALAEKSAPLDMISLDVDAALRELGAITGEVSNEDILDVMFSSFCVGK